MNPGSMSVHVHFLFKPGCTGVFSVVGPAAIRVWVFVLPGFHDECRSGKPQRKVPLRNGELRVDKSADTKQLSERDAARG
jgi:hypothetical protein